MNLGIDYTRNKILLPEHREALLQQERESQKKLMPILDEQAILEIERLLLLSLNTKEKIEITIFDEWGNESIIGVVDRFNENAKQVKFILKDNSVRYIPFKRIIYAQTI
jgi:hypothetical protein